MDPLDSALKAMVWFLIGATVGGWVLILGNGFGLFVCTVRELGQ